jgi:hypothetical protein
MGRGISIPKCRFVKELGAKMEKIPDTSKHFVENF